MTRRLRSTSVALFATSALRPLSFAYHSSRMKNLDPCNLEATSREYLVSGWNTCKHLDYLRTDGYAAWVPPSTDVQWNPRLFVGILRSYQRQPRVAYV
jgi:hypothetical protein